MAGKFAGAPDTDALWRLLCDGVDAIGEIPADRYDVDTVYSPEPRTPGRTVSRWGGFIDRIDEFDADFFGISPREAELMDPQQRLLLETAYEALEDAGQPAGRMAGTVTGTYVGQLGGDYWLLQHDRTASLSLHGMTGAASRAVASGRLAYAFDLRGPSMTVDTACSSSLVALHLAVQSLRSGECAMALAGGVNLILLPEEGIAYSSAGMLARDGRCKFGDASADGFVRSEGVGIAVLKPLGRAIADGDRIRAVIAGSAVGNDGDSSGYLVKPGEEGQRRVLAAAYRSAGIDPCDVDYVEAHGTGTSVGDPVELAALASVLGAGRAPDRPCVVGSVKTNVGHTEAAAGVAGLIKTVLCLEHGMVPPNLHLRNPNPAVPWDTLPLRIPRQPTRLAYHGRPAIAGISSFGFSGTNAHLVLTAPEPSRRRADAGPRRAECLVVSAATAEALRELAGRYADFLSGDGHDLPLLDICHSAAVRRDHRENRLAIVADSHEEAAEALRAVTRDEPDAAAAGEVAGERPRLAFVFPGQGSQWAGMGTELLDGEPAFAEALQECDEVIRAEAGWSVIDVLRAPDAGERLTAVDVVQPTLWAVDVALAALWRSWGVRPDVVIGHSMGEAAAAYVAGALSLADAGAVICRRSKLAAGLSGRGAMAWTELPAEAAAELVAPYGDRVAVAAENGPASTLLSGDPEVLADILAGLDERDVAARQIQVDYASHSPQMDEIRDDLLSALADLAPRAGATPIRSTLLGRRIDGARLDAAYWARNIREPVRFADAVRQELDAGTTVFVEISPHPVLAGHIKTTAAERGRTVTAVASLQREDPERPAMLSALAELHAAGVAADWQTITDGGRFVPLPPYCWQRESFWLPDRPRAATAPAHPLLGRPATSEDGTRVWEGPIDMARNAYLRDHRVQGTVILPGTAYVELAIAAAKQVFGDVPVAVSRVLFHRALFMTGPEPPELRVTVRPGDPAARCEVHARTAADGPWTLHAEASLRTISPPAGDRPDKPRARCTDHLSGADFYREQAARGNQWEGSFQAITELWRGPDEALGRIRCPESLAGHHAHPALLDACGQVLAAIRPDAERGEDGVFVLGSLGEVRLFDRLEPLLWSHVRRVDGPPDCFTGDVRIYTDDGRLVAEMRGLALRYLLGEEPVPGAVTAQDPSESGADGHADWLHRAEWWPVARRADRESTAAAGDPPGTWIVFKDSRPTAQPLIEALERDGHRVLTVVAAAAFGQPTADRFRARPGSADDIASVLTAAAAFGPCRGIVHLWSADAAPQGGASRGEIRRAEDLCCQSVLSLVQALARAPLPGSPRLWLITQEAQAVLPGDEVGGLFQAPLWGLGRTIAAENAALRPVLVDLDREPLSMRALEAELRSPGREDQLAVREGRWYAPRLLPHDHGPGTSGQEDGSGDGRMARVRIPAPGILDDLSVEGTGPAPAAVGPGEVCIKVSHAGLNYRDVLFASGVYPGQDGDSPTLGWECCGVVTAVGEDVPDLSVGDEVIAIAEGAMATHVVARACLTAPKPPLLSPANAATLPMAYVTAYQALSGLARVRPGERVLVHSASGGVGLAAVQVAQLRGAEVYGTAGSADKRAALDLLGVKNVSDSRSLRFVTDFQEMTGGAGFDVILNTLAGEAIQANLSLMAPHGRYVEISKRDIVEDNRIGLAAFAANLSFSSLDVVHMARNAPERLGAVFREVVDLVAGHALRPLPYREFPAAQAADAFRLMAQSRHIGKIVISFGPGSGTPALTGRSGDGRAARPGRRAARALTAGRRAPHIRPDATYLVTGALGGLGQAVTCWLADQGARHLLLTGRSAAPDLGDPAVRVLTRLRDRGVEARYASADVADPAAMRGVLDSHRDAGGPPVRGVAHLAGTICFEPLGDLTPAAFTGVLRAKVSGAWTLHRLLRDEPLDLFLLFSSGSALLNSPMLGAYAAGNAFLDAIAHYRRARGEPATSINWGFWDDAGMAARRQEESGRSLLPQGMRAFSPEDGLAVLERILQDDPVQVAVLRADWPAWAASHPDAAATPLLGEVVGAAPARPKVARPADPPPRRADPEPDAAPTPPLSRPTSRTEPPSVPLDTLATTPSTVPSRPGHPTPSNGGPADGADGIESRLRKQIATVLGLRAERVQTNRPLSKMGMDSLMIVEFRNLVERELGVKLPIVKLLDNATVTSVAQIVQDSLADAGSSAPAETETSS